jgi:hypothetical protein
MLEITIPEQELWAEDVEEFITIKETKLQLEHSLISLSKWESKYHKPFLDKKHQMTRKEFSDYVACMSLTKGVDPIVFEYLPNSAIKSIMEYIEDPMTATTFGKNAKKGMPKAQNKVITSEVIYYWMCTLNVPVQFEKWHLSRLLTLIRVINEENSPTKMNKKDIYSQNKSLNAMRRAKHHSRG